LSIKSGDILELSIEKLTFKGAGIARIDNFVVFVPDSCPGDKVRVKITKLKSTYAESRLIEVITPSQSRITPPCPYFSECGGCQWQHINYPGQISEKGLFLEEYFNKHLKVEIERPIFVFPSDKELHYRNRIRLHWDGEILGYFKRTSHQIIPISACLIANEKINLVLSDLRRELCNSHTGHRREADIFVDAMGKAVFNISPQNSPAMSFRQVNDFVNSALINQTKNLISQNIKNTYDLYCGEGNFAFFLAKNLTTKIIGVDVNKESIKRAEQKRIPGTALNLQFVVRDSLKYLCDLKTIPADSCFILNPPRSGCAPELIIEILRLRPAQILFISCDPPTLVRDLVALVKVYDLSSLFAFDMFPQTFHVECLVSLELRVF